MATREDTILAIDTAKRWSRNRFTRLRISALRR